NNGERQDYGFGWRLGEVRGHRIIEHGGAWQGFTSFVARYPDEKLTVVVFDNLSGGEAGRIAHGVAGLYHPELIPALTPAIADSEPRVTALMRGLVLDFARGSADSTLFTPEMRTYIFPGRAAQAREVLSEMGALRGVDLLERRSDNGRRIYVYRARFPEDNVR